MIETSRLIEAVYDDEEFNALSAEVANLVGARSFLIGFSLHDGSRELSAGSGWWPEGMARAYYDDYFQHDPWNQAIFADWRPNIARNMRDAVAARQVEDSLLYQGLVLPFGDNTFHALGLTVDMPAGIGGYGFQRGRDQTPFSDEATAQLEALARPLARLLEARGRMLGLERTIEVRDSTFDALSDMMVVVRPDAQLVSANITAECLLRSSSVLQMNRGHIRAMTRAAQRDLDEAIARATTTGFAACNLVSLEGATTRASLIGLPEKAGGHVLITIASPPEPATRSAMLAERYALSEGECAIALALAGGLTPHEIADQRGTSRHTVRQQIRMIAAKMECSRQVDIVRRVYEIEHLRLKAN